MNAAIDLTASDSEESSSTSNNNRSRSNQTRDEINYVYLVFYQEETYHGSVHSGDRYTDDPENLNKRCIGVYRSAEDANEAAYDYWKHDCGVETDDDNMADDDDLVNLFWDGSESGDVNN
eukprot:CAMPEP_0178974472 /NCGR_PEP_ID=MMETSP0789-20121207/22495_1 /TAXON_ID=3005 /ORGANISM="Rhizosolenia setigera, Strain CCMP 1694" /LENGTH=119 /DNA_ID=CAMNT_0020662849 /DNA_START=11 /DNA_END=370 /DNA_ORIENTATION=+